MFRGRISISKMLMATTKEIKTGAKAGEITNSDLSQFFPQERVSLHRSLPKPSYWIVETFCGALPQSRKTFGKEDPNSVDSILAACCSYDAVVIAWQFHGTTRSA